MSLLKVKDLGKSFGGNRAVDGVSFEVAAGFAVPIAGVAYVTLDLVKHRMDPAGRGVVLVGLHDSVGGSPIAGDGEVAGAGEIGAGDGH